MSSGEHKFDNIFLVLEGGLNTDHLGITRWRYLDENDHPRYMTRKEYDNFVDVWVEQLAVTKNFTSDMLSED